MMAHPAESFLMTSCGIESDEEMKRLGLFLAAHTVMDTRLISAIVNAELNKIGGAGLFTLDGLRDLVIAVSGATFGQHLARARDASLIPPRAIDIATEINTARNSFVHFVPLRFGVPDYNGQRITTEAGFRRCMDDVFEFLQLVPFYNVT
jgi:hypothetical protein